MKIPELEMARVCAYCKFFVARKRECKLPGVTNKTDETRKVHPFFTCEGHLWKSRIKIEGFKHRYGIKTPDEFT